MKLWGVAMVRNESDIIEAFVRHNLTVLDGLVVVDHGSSDATPRILSALCAERLPLIVRRADSPGYLQAEVMTLAARDVFAQGLADAVFTIDADEFVRVGSRSDLDAALAAVPPGHCACASWPTYVPDFAKGAADILELLRGSRRWHATQPGPRGPTVGKVVLTAAFAQSRSATVGMGSHGVILGEDRRTSPAMAMVDLDHRVVEICHVPVRTPPQFAVKIAVKRLARVAAGRDYAEGTSIREAYDAIRNGDPMTPESMLRSHLTVDAASLRATFAQPDLPDDRFLADFALRYTPSAPPDPLTSVLAAVDGLVKRAVATRRTKPNA